MTDSAPSPPSITATATASSSISSSPIRRLYRHVLEIVLSFSDLTQFHATMSVCKEWMAAIVHMPSIQAEISSEKVSSAAVRHSSLARHIGSIAGLIQMSPNEMNQLSRNMMNLRTLECTIVFEESAVADSDSKSTLNSPVTSLSLVFPSRLTHLSVSLCSSYLFQGSFIDFSAAMNAMSRLTFLTDLTIWLPRNGSNVRFTPLHELHSLRSLRIGWEGNMKDVLTDEQIADICTMHYLHSVHVDGLCEALFETPPAQQNIEISSLLSSLLSSSPMPLQWRSIHPASRGWRFNSSVCSLLPSLVPSLTEIDGWILGSHVDGLAGLSSLHTLSLRCRLANDATADSLMFGLNSCVHLTDLTLSGGPFKKEDLTALLPRLTLLNRLVITSMDQLDSLSFLSFPSSNTEHQSSSLVSSLPPLPAFIRSLTSLEVRLCVRIPISDLDMLHGLVSLEHLEIDRSFNAILSRHILQQYQPPSILMPSLESFVYVSPRR